MECARSQGIVEEGLSESAFSVPRLPRLGDHSLVTRKGNGGVACSGLSTLLSQGGMAEKRCRMAAQPYQCCWIIYTDIQAAESCDP